MKVASTAGVSPQDYIQQMSLRNPITPRVYRCILEGFQRFVAKQTTGKRISQETIRQWLNDRILVWPFHLVAHRARLVDRFLDWKVSKGALRSNPLGELRTEYGQRSTTPVVRALLNADFRSALDAIRPAPRFGSFLGPAMREHVNLMKAVGYRYNVHEERMLRLDRFPKSAGLVWAAVDGADSRVDERGAYSAACIRVPRHGEIAFQSTVADRPHRRRHRLGQPN